MKSSEATFADLNTHRALLTGRVKSFAGETKLLGRGVDVSIEILDGLQQGLSHQLTTNNMTIGADAGCDIVLLDDGIAPRHATIALKSSLFGTVATIQSAEAGVRVGKSELKSRQTSTPFTLPIEVSVGGVRVALAQRERTTGRRKSPLSKALDAVLLMTVVTLGLVVASVFVGATGSGSSNQRFTVGTQIATPQVAPEAREVQIESAAVATQEARQALEARLTEAGLADYLQVNVLQGSGLAVQGNLPESMFDTWRDLHSRLDTQGSRSLLVSNVTTAPDIEAFPPISSVRLSEPQELIFANGDRAGIGQTIANGWTIEAVSDSVITLSRMSETLSIDY